MGGKGALKMSQDQSRSYSGSTRCSSQVLRSVGMLSLALLIASASLPAPCHAATDPADVAALQAFYKGLKNTKALDWPADTDPCDTPAWTGVQCVQSPSNPPLRAVNSLQLQGLNLGGMLADAIGDLTVVKSIFLGGNSFAGKILGEGLLEEGDPRGSGSLAIKILLGEGLLLQNQKGIVYR